MLRVYLQVARARRGVGKEDERAKWRGRQRPVIVYYQVKNTSWGPATAIHATKILLLSRLKPHGRPGFGSWPTPKANTVADFCNLSCLGG